MKRALFRKSTLELQVLFLFMGVYSPSVCAANSLPSSSKIASYPKTTTQIGCPSEGFLTCSNPTPEVHFPDPPEPGVLPFVELDASAHSENTSFLALDQGKQIIPKTASDGSQLLHLRIPLKGPFTELRITAVDPFGKVVEEKITFHYPAWNDWVRWQKNEMIEAKRLSWSVGLGTSYITYSDPAVSNFSEITLTPKISARYWLKPRQFDLNANAYYTAIPVATSLNSVSARFFGANLRAGYLLPWLRDPWSLDVMAGFFYSTSFVTGSKFGYSNLLYPQLYPVLRRSLGYWDALTLYFKIVPMEHGLSLGLAQREIASGISWERTLRNGHPLTTGLDFSSLQFVGTNTLETTTVTSFTLGVGYGF